jgi:hypothetical protein
MNSRKGVKNMLSMLFPIKKFKDKDLENTVSPHWNVKEHQMRNSEKSLCV